MPCIPRIHHAPEPKTTQARVDKAQAAVDKHNTNRTRYERIQGGYDQITRHTDGSETRTPADHKDPRVIVASGNFELCPGETSQSALARARLHERVGRDGINALLKSNKQLSKQWDAFTAQIPEAELTAIGQSEAYKDLAGDRNAPGFESEQSIDEKGRQGREV